MIQQAYHRRKTHTLVHLRILTRQVGKSAEPQRHRMGPESYYENLNFEAIMFENIISLSKKQTTDPARRHRWTSTMLHRYGMKCRLHDSLSADCSIQERPLGDFLILELDMGHQAVAPTLREDACWSGDHLFLKMVKRGSISIEQNGNTRTFGEQSVLAVDPLHAYAEYFGEQSSVTVLRLPKQALRDRGLPYSFHDVHVGDARSPDLMAVRDFVLSLARQHGAISSDLGKRMSDLCLDFMDVVFNEGSKSGRRRTSATTLVLRAKQVIRRLARNPNLDMSWIARELNVSPNYLTRAFRTTGQTPMRYLMSLRLDLASQMLTEMNRQVKEIAFTCGFVSTSHFCTVFKREFGMSPLEFALAQQPAVSPDGKGPVATT
jgi:AraC-like DNA-binding protein